MTTWVRWTNGSLTSRLLGGAGLAGTPLQSWWQDSLLGRLQQQLARYTATSIVGRIAEPLAIAVFCLLLVISPFVSTPTIGAVLTVCLLLTVLLFAVRPRALSPLALPVLAFWLSGLIALVASPRFVLSLDGWVKMTLYIGSFALAAHLLQRPLYRTLAVMSYLLVSLPVSLYGLWQFQVGAPPLATWVDPESTLADATRVYSFLGNPNLLAAYLLAAIPLGAIGAVVWRNWIAKAFAATAATTGALCLVLTLSRGGWIALAVSSALLAVLLLQRLSGRLSPQWRPWLPVIVLVLLAIGLLVAVVAVPSLGERAASIFSGRDDSSNNFRINVWAAVIDMIRAYPLTGIGPGNRTFEAIYPFFQRPKFNALSAYSIVLEIAVELGILGLVAFGWLVVAALVQGFTVWQRRTDPAGTLWCAAALCGLVGLVVDGFTDTVWFRPAVQILWWLLCALIGSEFLRSTHRDDF
ncbi:IctB family putative bicarbonate transporter [Gloeobacter kilaueensis]|uniref:O-antigen polymerase n=1 Tax=Gloeobacter kilaueensis (strain ATCC BAA-2537 / CCAP 1431/1 / ULC 316 / JS1) TaxID=1183438 RepID=U5QPA2_GLOK1|nr:IctB family putative bicarbonate transporter [Gloeobacter kilaueensis]AGY60728.1 O-antigen polymerase [Gloeobacter kilaueensis JS1]